MSLRHHSGLLSPRKPCEQRPEQRPQLASPPLQWLAEPTPTERSEARSAPLAVVSTTTTVGGCAHAVQTY